MGERGKRFGLVWRKTRPRQTDPGLHRELKVEAAKRGLKIGELAERLMRGGLRGKGLKN